MIRPIRVLHMLPDMQLGGGQVLLLRTAKALRQHGVESLVCPVWRTQERSMTPQFLDAGVDVHPLALRRSRMPAAILRLLRLIDDARIDLIHTNNTHWDRRLGVIAGRKSGLPVVNTLHSMMFPPKPAPLEWLDRFLLRGGFDAAVAVSAPVRKAWRDYNARIALPDDRVRVIPPGIDAARCHPSDASKRRRRARQALGIHGEGPVLVNVARLIPGKGHLELIEIMATVVRSHPDALLLLVGDGPERPATEKAVKRHGLETHVRFLGQRDDVSQPLAAADLFAFTSKGEGFGLVFVEAMAAGLPIVAFDLPVLPGIFGSPPCGIAVPQGDLPSFARNVSALLKDPERCRHMGAAGRRRVATRFDVHQTAGCLADFYYALVQGARATRSISAKSFNVAG